MRKAVAVAVGYAGVVLAAAGGYWFFIRKHEGRPAGPPTCRIEFLSPDERVRRQSLRTPPKPPESFNLLADNQSGHSLPTRPAPLWRVPPATEADNPLLYNNNYAVVRFENPTGQPLGVYAIRGRGDKWPIIGDAFVVDVEIRNPSGKPTVKNPLDMLRSVLVGPPLEPPPVPPADELRQEPPPTFTIQPGEEVELPIRILNGLPAFAMPSLRFRDNPAWRFPPGVYTVRATVSYAEAPGGEKREVVSDPVKVTVTAEQVKAAEAFWNENKK